MACLVIAGMVPVANLAAAQAPPASSRARNLPELLDAAVESGELDRATADLHLARAFAGRARHREIPSRFHSDVPWHGTMPLFRLRQRLAKMPESPTKARIAETIAVAAATVCGDSDITLPNQTSTTHFWVEYGTLGGGLTISDYTAALEASWAKQVTSYGWAAPPIKPGSAPPGNRYAVRVDSLSLGLYGYVTTGGTYAGAVGDNPNTPWNDVDADASCMVLNSSYAGFPGSPLQALQATAAHEFNHAIQFGMGVQWGSNVPDNAFFEGIATWMEDEVFDTANDNWHYLWPVFHDSLGDYDGSPYEFWLIMRGLTEHLGTGTAGGGEQVMQDFWELHSKGSHYNLGALSAALATRGLGLDDIFHRQAIGTAFMRTCGVGYAAPLCFEEAPGYLAAAGLPPATAAIGSIGGSFSSTLEDDYSARWIALPPGSGYAVGFTTNGGQFRATAVCDTGTSLVLSPLKRSTVTPPALEPILDSANPGRLDRFDASSCVRRLAVITSQRQSAGNPSNPPVRSFTLSTSVIPRSPAQADFNGDGTTDVAVFRPLTGQWFVREQSVTSFGLPGDVPVAGDYDGNGSAEPAVFRPSVGGWYVSGQSTVFHGLSGDLPVPGDYDKDGDTDIAVFRPSTGQWFVRNQFTVSWGLPGDIPVPGDYDKDGDTDVAVFRPSTAQWFVKDQVTASYGLAGDVPVPGDYDGDGDADVAVYRPSVGGWYVKDQPTRFHGISSDVPVPGNYDADAAVEIAVYRPASGQWFIEGLQTVFYGLAADIPAPAQPGMYRALFAP